ncbi:MAG: large subunit ribosomal protein L21 [Chlamydiales bacterium]|jgi:large subunit ribosomal protein L21
MSAESYAIIETGSKQYTVKKDDVIDVELLDLNGEEIVEFSNVLFVKDGENVKIGSPRLVEFVVKGELLQQDVKGPKVISYKFKRRQNYHRKIGHRQGYTRVRITEIASAS